MNRTIALGALALTAAFGLSACGGSEDPLAGDTASATTEAGPIVVGGANFSESTLLAEIYAGALNAKGVKAETKLNIGSREIYLAALDDNSVQVFPEYTGALSSNYDANYNGRSSEEIYKHLKSVLPEGLTVLDKSAAEDNDSLNVTEATAKKYNLKTIDDLKSVSNELVLTAPPEFEKRPQGIPGLKSTYDVEFKSFVPLTGQGIVQALKNNQAQVANIFSTDPAISVNKFVTLEDTKKVFGSQNVVPLVRTDRADEVSGALNAVSAKLTTEDISEMLKRTDVDKDDASTVAQDWLKENGLG